MPLAGRAGLVGSRMERSFLPGEDRRLLRVAVFFPLSLWSTALGPRVGRGRGILSAVSSCRFLSPFNLRGTEVGFLFLAVMRLTGGQNKEPRLLPWTREKLLKRKKKNIALAGRWWGDRGCQKKKNLPSKAKPLMLLLPRREAAAGSLSPHSFSLRAPLLLSFLKRGYSCLCECTTVDLGRFHISFCASFFFVLFFFKD